MRSLRAAIGRIALALVALAAIAGVAISAASLLAATGAGRRAVASWLVRIVDDAVAGSLELDGIGVLPSGAVELRGLRVFDPDGHLVLAVDRALALADVTAARSRTLGISLELDSPTVLLEEERDGGVSLARAFAPSHPSPEQGRSGGGPSWTLHLSRLAIRGGEIWWVDEGGRTRLEARDLDVDARASLGADRARAEVRLRGALEEPLEAPVSLDLVAGRTGDAVRLPLLRAAVGGTAVSAVGLADLATRTGRIAVTRLALDRAEARTLAPAAPEGADLGATAYGESDGEVLTAAVRVAPALKDAAGGRADAAVATRVRALGRALGFDVALDRLDPSKVAAGAPAGEVTLAAHGAATGRTAADLRGRVAISVSRSRLRKGEIERADLVARADRGSFDVERLRAAAPGVALDGEGRWREGGPVEGRLAADAPDLAALSRNLAGLLGVSAPALGGRARIEATLAGTASAPAAAATVDAPALRLGEIVASGVRVTANASGTARAPVARIDGRIAAVREGTREMAREIALRASLASDEATLSAAASVPGAGTEPYAMLARGRFEEGREKLVLSGVSVSYPGTRWALAAPAVVTVRGPSVDRLEISSGPQRIAILGGLSPGGDLDARIVVQALDLAKLPPGITEADDAVAGELSLEVRATGTASRPDVQGRLSVARGAFRAFEGVDASGEGRWDGVARRAAASLSLAREAGGTVDLSADVPVPIDGRPGERISVKLRASDLPIEEIAGAAGASGAAISGKLGADLVLEGQAGAPAMRGEAAADDVQVNDLGGLSFWLSVEAPGERIRVTAGGAWEGGGSLAADASAPLDLALALARPDAAVAALKEARLSGTAALTGVDLARIAGRAGVPAGIAGTAEAHAAVGGSLAGPRGNATLEVARGAWSGYGGIGARLDVTLGERSVAASGRVSLGTAEAIRLDASVGAPIERFGSTGALRAAALRAEAVVPGVALAGAGSAEVPLCGTVKGRLAAAGSLGAPDLALDLSGTEVAIAGRPLGAVDVRARHAQARSTAEVRLRPAGGGEIRSSLALDADLGLGSAGGALRDAPAEAAVVAEALDLGFVPAIAPGLVRTAAGKLTMDVRAKGPLARMSPRGSLRVERGEVAVAELGEWSGIAVDASVADGGVEVSRIEVHRGKGRLTANGSLRGLFAERAVLEAHLATEGLTIARAGMDLATFDVRVDATGSVRAGVLDVEASVQRGVVRLPNRTPRVLQTIEGRKDIVIGSAAQKRRPGRRARAAAGQGAAAEGPAAEGPPWLVVRAIAPRALFVRSDDPKVDVELKADVRFELAGEAQYAQGAVEVVKGSVEPLSGRVFQVERGRVQFTGGPPEAAIVDVQARYDNPAAKVTVNVTGPATAPEVKLSSLPPLDEQQIAMLIATGKTELKAGAGGIGTLSGEEAGKAALAAVATKAFKELVAKKLPLDTVALEPGALRAGKYVTDKIYVGYTRRLDADPEKGENRDEVRVEYQISPRWSFESRYGNAQSGGANLIWSKDY